MSRFVPRRPTSNPSITRLLEAAPLLLIAGALGIGRMLRGVALDDPYVTYRYAENLLRGVGPVYNPGEWVLSTTALGYALLLALLSALLPWLAMPALSNAVSAGGLGLLALALHRLAARNGRASVGLAAGGLVLLSPLLASTFGLETCLFLGAVGWSAAFFAERRLLLGALLAAFSTLLRADGALAFAILAAASLLERRPGTARAVALYLAIVLPYELALTLVYGSPLPVTLAAKTVQATIGGWPDYWGGLREHLEAMAAAHLYWPALPLLLAGLASLPRRPWAAPLMLWGLVQAVVYQALGVASYDWYYAPLIPAGALLIALGADVVAAIIAGMGSWGRASTLPLLLVGALVAPVAFAELRDLRALRASVPEPRALAYQHVGEWLDANASADARVAVMEVGIIGYYAHRPMVDLLGLIQPRTVDAMRRLDFFWTIADSQADLVVLTSKNPLWFQSIEPSHWFNQLYAPVERIDQPGFWGTPLTIYRRLAPLRQPPLLDAPGPGRFGDASGDRSGTISLDRVVLEKTTVHAGDFLTAQLFWRALAPVARDYSAFVHVVNAEPRVVAQHDTPVVTSRWPVDRVVQYYHPMRLPPDLPPGRYRVEVGLYLPEEPLRRLVPLDRPNDRNVAQIAELFVEP